MSSSLRSSILAIVITLIISIIGYKIIFRENKKISIDIMLQHDEKEMMSKLVEKYEKENQNIEVNLIVVDIFNSVPSLKEKYLKNHELPDIFLLVNDHIAQFIEIGLLMEVKKEDLEYTFEKVSAGFEYKDKYYGFPYKLETIFAFYNKKIINDIPNNIEDIMKYSKEVEKKLDIEGIAFPIGEPYFHYPWYTYFGGTVETFINLPEYPEILLNELRFVKNNFKSNNFNYNYVVNLFNQEKLGILLSGPWTLESIENSNVEYDFEIIKDKSFRPFLGVKGLGINKESKNKKEALKLVKYLTEEENQKFLDNELGFIPANKEVLKISNKKLSLEVLDQIEKLVIIPNVLEIDEIWKRSTSILNKVFNSDKDIERAISEEFSEKKEK